MTGDGMEITLRDVYDATQQAAGQISGVSAQVSELKATVELRLDNGQKRMDDMELRLRAEEQRPRVSPHDFREALQDIDSLKSWRGKAIGVGLTLAALTGVATFLVEHAVH